MSIPMDKCYSLFLHEAGHYVVARSLAIRVDRLFFEYVFPPRGQPYYRGVTKFLPQKIAGTEEIIRYCKARIIVLMAGKISEHVCEYEGESGIEKQEAFDSFENADNSDFWKTRELLVMLVGLTEENVNNFNEKQIEDIYKRIYLEIFERACAIVMENISIIGQLALQINRHYGSGNAFIVNKYSLEEMPLLDGVKHIDP